jgi:outer membrane biosynthesis protein TonB
MDRRLISVLVTLSLIVAVFPFVGGPAVAQEPVDDTSGVVEALTEQPTDVPTEQPTDVPTEQPTDVPTEQPTDVPTEQPTDVPTEQPTDVPTEQPTDVPTEQPTDVPTEQPTDVPTEQPTDVPTEEEAIEEPVEEEMVDEAEEAIVEPDSLSIVEEADLAAAAEVSGAAISVSAANTSFQVQDLSGTGATVIADYYPDTGGTAVTQQTIPVPANSSVNIYQPTVPGLPSGFKGSVVLSSDKQIGAVGGMVFNWSNGKQGGANYSGLSQDAVGNTFYLPNISKAFGGGVYSTKIVVQNVGSTSVSVEIKYYRGTDGVQIGAATETGNIAAYGSKTFEQVDNANLPSGFLGGAVVSATGGQIAVVGLVYNDQGRLQAYNGFADGSTFGYLPTVLRSFGAGQWTTSFQIMAIEGGSTNVDVEYYGPSGLVQTVPQFSLSQYQSINRYQGADIFLSNNEVYSVLVKANKKVVVVVNQAQGGGGIGTSSYNGGLQGATKFFLPAVMKYFGAGNYISSFQIMNVGTGTAANVTVKYYNSGSATPFKTVTYGPGGDGPALAQYQSINRFLGSTSGPQPDGSIGNGWIGAVVVESTNGVPIVVIHSAAGYAVNGDGTTQYNGVSPQ